MPLLDDAKNCFVGQTQIKKIYAGTQLVWPKGPSVPDRLSLHKYDPKGMFIVFDSLLKSTYIPCEYVKTRIRWRFKRTSDPSFTQWYDFDNHYSYIQGTDPAPDVEWTYRLCVLIGSPPPQSYQGAIFEVWKTTDDGENAWIESIVMDLNIPSETLPDFDYGCDSNAIP